MPRLPADAPLYIYILRCADQSYYTGLTTNIRPRLLEHNLGKASFHTGVRRPVTLAYLEGPLSAAAAYARERQIKRWSAKKKADLITHTDHLCQRLRAQIAATGAEAIGAPPDPSIPHSALELRAMLSFIRDDLAADALEKISSAGSNCC